MGSLFGGSLFFPLFRRPLVRSRKDLGLRSLADVDAWFARNTSYGGLIDPGPRRKDLEPIRTLLEEGGRPQDSYPLVQVVGTRGKGTTASFLAQLLQAKGLKVGLFLSPHLMRLSERIQVNGREIPGHRMASLLEEVLFLPRGWEAGFFDLMTMVAALHFAREGVDLAVFEAGRGGETDSTTALGADLVLFTTVDRDHMEALGETVEERARVKAAALRPGGAMIAGMEIHSPPGAVALGVARHRGASFLSLGRDFSYAGLEWGPWVREVRLRAPGLLESREEWRLRIRSLAPFLDLNAALAGAAFLFMGKKGLLPPGKRTPPSTLLEVPPGRFEVVRLDPPLVLDGAQSPLAFEALLHSWTRAFGVSRPPRVLLALGKDKDSRGVMQALKEGGAREVALLRSDPYMGRSPEELLEDARRAGLSARVLPDALQEARGRVLSSSDPWLVTGSFYLVGAFHASAPRSAERFNRSRPREEGTSSGESGS